MSLLSVQREGHGSPFVWLHGFTQTRNSARPFRSILAGSHELWTLDLPGHGDSSPEAGSLDDIADAIAQILPRAPVALGGYSLGARVAMHVALRHGGQINRLVLLGASRGIRDETERRQRRERDERLATRVEAVGAVAFLDEWLAQPLFATLSPDNAERASRSVDAAGMASSLRRSGTGTQQWLGVALGAVECPTLALAGSLDAKFAHEAEEIARAVPRGSFDLIADAGHAAHVEQPERVAKRIAAFLAATA